METILGIDLGTTNSAVSIIRDGKAEVLRERGEAILPSVVGLDPQGQLLIGVAARNQCVVAPERTVRSIKRKMGQAVTVKLGDQEYTPPQISSFILKELKERAERVTGESISKAVITVPAFFDDNQREATRQAGELAGLQVVRIINEPTAASLTYPIETDDLQRLLVYDLGGGTFDVSVVQVEAGVVEVLASHGDTELGGDDFDALLLDYVCDQFNDEHGVDLRDDLVARSRVLQAVENAKIQLSSEPIATIEEEFIVEKDGKPLHLTMEISRLEYEEMIEPLLVKTLDCLDRALTDAKWTAEDIDKVILVGGSSRTPLVHKMLNERLGQPLHSEVDPDLCVSMGAAIQGGLVAGLKVGPVLVDITPHTLGVQALGTLFGFQSPFLFAPIIERNTPLPVKRSEMFYTSRDGQKMVQVCVYQGEDEDVRHNRKIGDFELDNLSGGKAGEEIEVRFNMDVNGILNVTAIERATGMEKSITIERVSVTKSNEPVPDLVIDDEQESEDDVIEVGVTVPDSLPGLTAEASSLVNRATELLNSVHEEDAAELQNLLERLKTSPEDDATIAELEDLVFYLDDKN